VNWIEALSDKIVALDSSPLIYFIERQPVFFEQVWPFFEAVERRDFTVLTSVVTLTEVLVHPLRHGYLGRVNAYHNFFAQYLPSIQVSPEIAETAAHLRAEYNLRTPDAIQVATAITHKADYFLTNDARLGRIKQIEVLVLSDLSA
jgi:predicted nucleic acid-binding protein